MNSLSRAKKLCQLAVLSTASTSKICEDASTSNVCEKDSKVSKIFDGVRNADISTHCCIPDHVTSFSHTGNQCKTNHSNTIQTVDSADQNIRPTDDLSQSEQCEVNSETFISCNVNHNSDLNEQQNVVIEVDDPELRELIESQGFSLGNYQLTSDPSTAGSLTTHLSENENLEMEARPSTNPSSIIHSLEITENRQVEEGVDQPIGEMTDEQREHVEGDKEEDLEHATCKGWPKKGRKRKFEEQTREIKKRKVNTNQDYISTKGEQKFGKKFRDYLCKCKCNEVISVEERNVIFSNFQQSGSYEARCFIIQGMVKEVPIKRKRVKGSQKKTASREYYLSNKKVCKSIFMHTLRVSSCVIDKALKKKGSAIADGRGRGGGHNKLPSAKIEEVIQHISKFPRYKSHYCRSSTAAEYLHPETTLSVMYNVYCKENDKPVSLAMYKKVFLNKFHLKRKPLKKDTCNVCDRMVIQKNNASTAELQQAAEEKHNKHLEMAEYARQLMNKQFKDAKNDVSKEMECICFDLEKTLPLPRIPTNVVFYKRQLWFYNFGIHDSNDNGYCYTWVEGDAGRGAQEVGSALRKHILCQIPSGTKHLSLWSDSCAGHNRNIKIVLILKAVLEEHPSLEDITQRFLVPGHSFLRNDSDFSDIESALKLQQRLYVPEDYEEIIKRCRKKNPLRVSKMAKEDFVGTSNQEKAITNRKHCVEGEKVNWLTFKVVQVRKSDPLSLFIKTDLQEENFVEIDLGKKVGRKSKGKGVQKSVSDRTFFSSKFTFLWPNGKPISQEKLNDLQSLFHLIPNDCLPFYRNLTSSNSIQDDIEGFSGEPDFEPDDSA